MLDFIAKYISYRELLVIIVLLASLNSCSVKSNSSQTPESPYGTLIKNVKIVSAENNSVSPVLDVLIKNGRIAEIASDISENTFRKLQVVEGMGLYMTAGLIDSNTHIGKIPGMNRQDMRENPELLGLAREQLPLSYLFYGFTTLVDLNASAAVSADWNRLPIRPQAYHCGGVPVLGGPDKRNASVDILHKILPFFLLEKGAIDLPEGVDARQHTPSAVVSQIAEDGAVCIKTHYKTGTDNNKYWTNPSVDLLSELIEQSHEKMLPVIIHANSESAAHVAVVAGADAVVHGLPAFDDNEPASSANSQMQLIASVLSRKISWQPALQSFYGMREARDQNLINNEELQHVLPARLLSWHKSVNSQRYESSMVAAPYFYRQQSKPGFKQYLADSQSRAKQSLRHIANSGGSLLFGSDSPGMSYASSPGLGGRMEIRRWQNAGVQPLRFLEAATIANARFFGLEDELGTVETGKKANLLLLSRNPAESLDAWDSIQLVIVDGRVINRGMLSALVSY